VHTQVGHLEAAIAIIDVAFDDIAERAATAGFDWQWPTTRSEEISGWDKLACLIGRFFQTQNVACRTRPTPGHEVDVTIPAAIAPPRARARWKGRRIVHRARSGVVVDRHALPDQLRRSVGVGRPTFLQWGFLL